MYFQDQDGLHCKEGDVLTVVSCNDKVGEREEGRGDGGGDCRE